MPYTQPILKVRPAAVAGRFYPAVAGELAATVRGHIEQALPGPAQRVRAIIGPHAGYIYSGAIAGSVYAAAAGLRGKIDRVVLVGPSHYVAFEGLAVPSHDAFETPLGRVPLDRAAVERALGFSFVHMMDEAHAREHGLEVHLPFLQMTLGAFSLVPVVCGRCGAEEVAHLVEALWTDDRTLVVVSSDLSHYLSYDQARDVDRATARAIEQLTPHAIGSDQACGQLAIQGLLLVVAKRNLRMITLDLRNSGDTAGSRDRVVGYGAWVAV